MPHLSHVTATDCLVFFFSEGSQSHWSLAGQSRYIYHLTFKTDCCRVKLASAKKKSLTNQQPKVLLELI